MVERNSPRLRLDLRIQQPNGMLAVVEILDVNRLLSASGHHPCSWIQLSHRDRVGLTIEVERRPGLQLRHGGTAAAEQEIRTKDGEQCEKGSLILHSP